MLKKLFSILSLLSTLAVFSLVLIAGGEKTADPVRAQNADALTAAGLLSGSDLQSLASHFGASVPYRSASGYGQVEDTSYPGGYARKFTFTDQSGLVITAVRPAAAAQLLNPGGLSFDASQVYAVSDMTAVMATDDSGTYLYFSDDLAAYCLHGREAPNAMLSLIGSLQFTN